MLEDLSEIFAPYILRPSHWGPAANAIPNAQSKKRERFLQNRFLLLFFFFIKKKHNLLSADERSALEDPSDQAVRPFRYSFSISHAHRPQHIQQLLYEALPMSVISSALKVSGLSPLPSASTDAPPSPQSSAPSSSSFSSPAAAPPTTPAPRGYYEFPKPATFDMSTFEASPVALSQANSVLVDDWDGVEERATLVDDCGFLREWARVSYAGEEAVPLQVRVAAARARRSCALLEREMDPKGALQQDAAASEARQEDERDPNSAPGRDLLRMLLGHVDEVLDVFAAGDGPTIDDEEDEEAEEDEEGNDDENDGNEGNIAESNDIDANANEDSGLNSTDDVMAMLNDDYSSSSSSLSFADSSLPASSLRHLASSATNYDAALTFPRTLEDKPSSSRTLKSASARAAEAQAAAAKKEWEKAQFPFDLDPAVLNADYIQRPDAAVRPYSLFDVAHQVQACEMCLTLFASFGGSRRVSCGYCGRQLCARCCDRTLITPAKILQEGSFSPTSICSSCDDHLRRTPLSICLSILTPHRPCVQAGC